MTQEAEFQIDYKKISQIDWGTWGGEAVLYLTGFAFWTQLDKFYGRFNLITYFEKNFLSGYQNLKELGKVAKKIVSQQKRDGKYIDKIIKPWNELAKKQHQLLSQIDKTNLSRLNEKDFIKLHKKIFNLRYELWRIAFRIEPFDFFGDSILAETIQDYSLNSIEEKELRNLLAPKTLSYLREEKLELLKLALKVSREKNVKKLFLETSKRKDLDEIKKTRYWWLLSLHNKKYFYLQNNWGKVWHLDEFYFAKKIKEILKKDVKNIQKEIREIKNYPEEIKSAEAKIYKKYKIPKGAKNVFYLFSRIAEWRDERKKLIQTGGHYAYKFLKEIARRNKIDIKILEYIDPFEIKTVNLSREYITELKLRRKGCAFVFDKNNNYQWVSGEKARKVKTTLEKTLKELKKIKEIKGVGASPGNIRGKTKIIFTHKDFSKIKKGDILVTSMTRPEFMPILKKAGAIITDEGGITCHAAILSRELNIPCIIGTKIATKALKDGDLVEVNANKGIIRKIKNKR